MMKRTLLALPLLALFAACGGDKEHDNHGGKGDHDQNSHADDNDKDGHGSGSAAEHGEPQPLGKMTAFGRSFDVVQLGDIEAGKEGAVELEFASAAERITTIRAWIGVASGEGSRKDKMMLEGKTSMHGHVEVPDPIPANSKLWLDLEVDGKRETHSTAFK